MNWFTHHVNPTTSDSAAEFLYYEERPGREACWRAHTSRFLHGSLIGSPVVFSAEELHRVESPMLLLIGGQSVIYDPERIYRRAIGMIPNIEAEIIPDASHGQNAEKSEFVNARILQFCRSKGEL
jgi:pimeloyl-ACP methyl ester carboxylesterase